MQRRQPSPEDNRDFCTLRVVGGTRCSTICLWKLIFFVLVTGILSLSFFEFFGDSFRCN